MDADSFKQRFLPLHPRLYRVAYAMTENAADAEDILQEAYCKLWDRREELEGIRSPEAFCVTLVKNMCLDFVRSAGYNRREEEVTDHLPILSEVSPEKEIIEQENIIVINGLINELPDNQRKIIRLWSIDECSMQEIEQITGLSAVNIRVLLSRARKTIRTRYDEIRIRL